jgi:transcriptional regulator NrdR family protein
MQAYLTHTSPRPGCPCCDSKHLHGLNTNKSGYRKSYRKRRRTGKKCARKLGKREIVEQLKDFQSN